MQYIKLKHTDPPNSQQTGKRACTLLPGVTQNYVDEVHHSVVCLMTTSSTEISQQSMI